MPKCLTIWSVRQQPGCRGCPRAFRHFAPRRRHSPAGFAPGRGSLCVFVAERDAVEQELCEVKAYDLHTHEVVESVVLEHLVRDLRAVECAGEPESLSLYAIGAEETTVLSSQTLGVEQVHKMRLQFCTSS